MCRNANNKEIPLHFHLLCSAHKCKDNERNHGAYKRQKLIKRGAIRHTDMVYFHTYANKEYDSGNEESTDMQGVALPPPPFTLHSSLRESFFML